MSLQPAPAVQRVLSETTEPSVFEKECCVEYRFCACRNDLLGRKQCAGERPACIGEPSLFRTAKPLIFDKKQPSFWRLLFYTISQLILVLVKKLEKLFIAPKVRQELHETAQRAFARCECAQHTAFLIKYFNQELVWDSSIGMMFCKEGTLLQGLLMPRSSVLFMQLL